VLPAAARLRQRAEFTSTIRGGARRVTARLVCHLDVDDDRPGPARVGFVVGKDVGPAVTRNLVRRRLRHAIRAALPTLPAGARLVVRANPASASASFAELDHDLTTTLARLARTPAP
jgi:ribonuclease P protein component